MSALEEQFLLEDYKSAKTELRESISSQYRILSFLVTASAASFIYMFSKEGTALATIDCVIIPGIFFFFGILWLDEVYRQERLASYVHIYERKYFKGGANNSVEGNGKGFSPLQDSENGQTADGTIGGWEAYVNKEKKPSHKTSRLYYYMCFGLFSVVPIAVYVCGRMYIQGLRKNSFNIHKEEYELCEFFGFVMIVLFAAFSIFYIMEIYRFYSKIKEGQNGDSNGTGSENNKQKEEVTAGVRF